MEPLFPSPKRNWALTPNDAAKAEQQAEEKRNAFRSDAVTDLLRKNKSGRQLFAVFERQLKLAQTNNDSVSAAYLWPALTEAAPRQAGQLSTEIIRKGECLSAGFLYPLLFMIGRKDPKTVLDLLRMASERLQPEWIKDWLKKPSDIVPGTRMPAYWPDYPKSFYPHLGGDAEAQITAIRDYLMTFRGGPSPKTGAKVANNNN